MYIIVGSTALQAFGTPVREPKDLDIFTDNVKLCPEGDVHVLPTELLVLIPCAGPYAVPDAIYTIKCSHAAWDIKWEKTMNDIMWLKKHNCKLIEPLYWKLYEHWKTVHGDKSFLSLKKAKDEFFNDYVNYKYDHDWLHKVVAFPGEPVYTMATKDGEDVLISKDKFNSLSNELKCKMFREEIKVIALERYLIPTNFRMSIQEAYRRALKKTITNLTKNWATLFIIENFESLRKMEDKNWVENFYMETGVQVMTYPKDIEILKDKAEQLGIDDDNYELQEILVNGDNYYDKDSDDPHNTFVKYLTNTMGFEHIEQDGGGEGGGESCHSVIKLNGNFYRLDYSYYSYDGFHIDDVWDWKLVTPNKREVTFYE